MREIGRGGMAIVYAARQPDLDRQVALKELSSFHANSAEFAHRFLRESRLAGSLNHPNIVTVHEYFEHAGTPYIAMELVPRGSLRPHVRQLSLAQVAGVLEGILAALAHAETAGIVHRDLKPENVMVTADGRVKIADFGIARATQRAGTDYVTATGMTVGTPTYMAPEQAMAGEVGPWTDLYSVGVLTYELIVGRPPFTDSDSPLAILMRHVNEPIPSAVELEPSVDLGLSQWIDSLLVKDPAQRVRHALDAWESLEEIIVRLLGPLWRRDARVLADRSDAVEADPLTPAPFESHVSIVTPTPKPSEVAAAFITFDPGRPKREAVPEPEPAPVVVADPEVPEPEMPEPEEPAPVILADPEPEPAPPPPDAPTPRVTASPSRARALIPALIAAIAAAVGFIVSPGSHRAPPQALALTQTASAGHVAISYPSVWRPAGATDPAPGSLRLSAPVAIVPRQGGGALFVGTTTATDSTLLPKGLGSTLAAPPQGAAVKLGSLVFRRYLNLLPQGAAAPETVYALPTTAGTVIASCIAPTVDATLFASTCERAVGSLRLTSAAALTLTANPAFAKSLGGVVATLDAARGADGRRLAGARRPADQAVAARRLAQAHDDAAKAAARLSPGPVGADANAAIVAALKRLGSAYASLAQAASHHDGRNYAAASTAVSQADAALGAAFARLSQDGYSID
ncbi:MAG: serine/threonine-protein kinase [Solirubrobacteraceae bacterium]